MLHSSHLVSQTTTPSQTWTLNLPQMLQPQSWDSFRITLTEYSRVDAIVNGRRSSWFVRGTGRTGLAKRRVRIPTFFKRELLLKYCGQSSIKPFLLVCSSLLLCSRLFSFPLLLENLLFRLSFRPIRLENFRLQLSEDCKTRLTGFRSLLRSRRCHLWHVERSQWIRWRLVVVVTAGCVRDDGSESAR